jgi:hypothetical protein
VRTFWKSLPEPQSWAFPPQPPCSTSSHRIDPVLILKALLVPASCFLLPASCLPAIPPSCLPPAFFLFFFQEVLGPNQSLALLIPNVSQFPRRTWQVQVAYKLNDLYFSKINPFF